MKKLQLLFVFYFAGLFLINAQTFSNEKLKNFQQQTGAAISFNSATQTPEFIRFSEPLYLPGQSLQEKTNAFLAIYSDAFGIKNPADELKREREQKDTIGFSHLKLQQYYQDIPVFGAKLIFHFNKNPQPAAPVGPAISCPVDLTVECNEDTTPAATGSATATSDCPGAVTVIFTDSVSTASCPSIQLITRTWTATDECSDTATCIQMITTEDTTPPVLDAPPAGITVSCFNLFPGMTIVGYNDNCGQTGSVAGEDFSDNGTCPEIITRVWTHIDPCGNIDSVSQTITIHDLEAPVINNVPADATYQCLEDVPAIPTLNFTDNCSVSDTIVTTETITGDACSKSILRTWSLADNCGNLTTEMQSITVTDTIAPVVMGTPQDVTVACPQDIPAMTGLAWNDNCDGNGVVDGVDVSNNQSCPEIIIRTWTYTDTCGNTNSASQMITVIDEIRPTLSPAPLNITVSCDIDVPDMITLDWTDNCDGTGFVSGVDVNDGLTCPKTITRKWSYTDNCGNKDSVMQIITVHDLIFPLMSDPPPAVQVQCINNIPDPVMLSWSDNCDGTGAVAPVDTITNETCPKVISRKWTYTDGCGNSNSRTQLITVQDNFVPEFETPPSGIVVNCHGNIPDMIALGWTDNCEGPNSVMGFDVSDNSSCPETITRTWLATDACGNTNSATQLIIVQDLSVPEMTSPGNMTVPCIEDIPEMIALEWTDNCDGMGTVMGFDSITGTNCPFTVIRSWTYTDSCGNTGIANQIFTVNDQFAPTLEVAPSNMLLSCHGDIPDMMALGWTDNCGTTGNVMGVDISNNMSCPETITRRWVATDLCGNTSFVEQNFIVNDQTLPLMDPAPATLAVECTTEIPDMVALGWTDNCDGEGTIMGIDSSDGLSCPETITRIWAYTDTCGNTFSRTQIITVRDLTQPVMIAPADISYQCPEDVPALDSLVWTDNCDGTGNAPGNETIDGAACMQTIVRTWEYTDNCDNVAMVTQNISVEDTMGPVFTTAPDDLTVDCPADVPALANLTATDNCSGDIVAVPTQSSNGLSCPEMITRTWSATDNCGNNSVHIQIITVLDYTPGTFTNAPANEIYQCIDDVPTAIALNWTGGCGESDTVTPSQTSTGSCPTIITRKWSQTDLCGNLHEHIQTITVFDTTAPVLESAPADTMLGCSGTLPMIMPLGWTDNCDGTGTVMGIETTIADTLIRTWTYTDFCGNETSVSQRITLSASGPDNDGDGICDDTDPDDDNDGIPDGSDLDAFNPMICADADGDGCDDCSVGVDGFGPAADNDTFNDGPDADGDGICDLSDSCPENLIIPGDIISGTILEEVSNNITSTALIVPPANIDYSAGVDIDLLPGFEVELSAEFHAYILGCTLPAPKLAIVSNLIASWESKADVAILNLELKESTTISISLYDEKGIFLWKQLETTKFATGIHCLEIATDKLQAGIYVVKILVGKKLYVEQITVNK